MNPDPRKHTLRQIPTRTAKTFHFKSLLQSKGWLSPAFVDVDERGIILRIADELRDVTQPVEFVNGIALPGFQNAHSHAFHFATSADANGGAHLDPAGRVDPDQFRAVATMAYMELVKRGFTHVAEFHYLHHDTNGKPFKDQAEMSVSLVAAAAIAGIRITLIPAFSRREGFGKEAVGPQRRFCFGSVEEYFSLLEDCAAVIRDLANSSLGVGIYSPGAVDPEDVRRIAEESPSNLPFHVQATERGSEAEACVHHLKARPVEWLLDHTNLKERLHLIHVPKLSESEEAKVVVKGARIVVCPGSINKHDYGYRHEDFGSLLPRVSMGTDRQILMNPLENLQRLDGPRVGEVNASTELMKSTFFAGKKAMGKQAEDYFEVGRPLDAVVYHGDSPLLSSCPSEQLLSVLIKDSSDGSIISGTLVNGQWICNNLRHKDEEIIERDFLRAMQELERS